MRQWNCNYLVLCAVIVHGGWGFVLLFDATPLMTTPMAESPMRHDHYLAAMVYLGVAALAGVVTVRPAWEAALAFKLRLPPSMVGLTLCLPQQFLLMMSAFSAINCVLRGSYADGVPRAWTFILCDQLWNIVSMIGHTVALIDWYILARK